MKRYFRALFIAVTVFSLPAHAFQVIDGQIYDQDGKVVQLRGVNWFGFETNDHLAHGLWARNWREMISQIKQQGFNALRLPVCPDTLSGQTNLNVNAALNPDLQGLNSRDILDLMVEQLDAEEIYVLLDHHRPDCAAISELWYTASYSEQAWIDDLVWMAHRYKHLPHFIGIDLKNEPHGQATWGNDRPATDWNHAAERAAGAILAEAPDLLIFVEGVGNSTDCSGTINHWWGGNLEPISCYPLDIPANQLVLSPHVYGPDAYSQPYFSDPAFPANMAAIWDQHIGQFSDQGYAVVIGEFGGRYGHGGDPADKVWQDALIDYLISRGLNSGFYWSWNPNSGDTGGILRDNWSSVWDDKVALLNRLWGAAPPAALCSDGIDNDQDGLIDYPADSGCDSATDQSESDSPVTACSDGIDNDLDGKTDFPHDPDCTALNDDDELDEVTSTDPLTVTTVVASDWSEGYCADVEVGNPGDSSVDWRVELMIDGSLKELWSADYSSDGQQLSAQGLSWNNEIPAHGTVSFGYCADRTSVAPAPAQCSDGVDNDGDQLVDYPNDPGCLSTIDDSEVDQTGGNHGNSLSTTVTINDDWTHGYCADVVVNNPSPSPVEWQVQFDIYGVINDLWNAHYQQQGSTVTAHGVDWNRQVAATSSVQFGFCATR